MSNFQLAPEDALKIAYIQRAAALTAKGNLTLFGSVWTAPPWLKAGSICFQWLWSCQITHFQTQVNTSSDGWVWGSLDLSRAEIWAQVRLSLGVGSLRFTPLPLSSTCRVHSRPMLLAA